VRSDVVKGRVYGAVAIAALVVLVLYGCARPLGTVAKATIQPSATPVAAHAPLTIANPVFHSGEVGVTYAPVTLSAAGGVPPYTWTSIGSLPAGLTLSSDGVVSGTPAQNGYFAFGVQVLDFGNNDTAGLPVNIPIVPRLTASLVSGCATECTVELGCVSVCGTFGQVSGGAAPITYSLTSGSLPAGTSLNGLSLNGTFTGLPGRLQFTVQVTDGFGATALVTARYNLIPHISFPGGSITCPYGGCEASLYYPHAPAQLPYSGGIGTPAVGVTGWQVLCSTSPCPYGVPPKPKVAISGAYVVIYVPSSGYGGGYTAVLTLVLTDMSPCASGTHCSTSGTVNVTVLGGG
jgi:large repetitive protein